MAAGGAQAELQQAVHHVRVDVAAAQDGATQVAARLNGAGEERRQGDGAGGFGDGFGALHQKHDSFGDGLVEDRDDVVDVAADQGQGVLAWSTGYQAIGNGLRGLEGAMVSIVECQVGGVGAPGLHADNTDLRLDGFRGDGHAGDEPAAADRHYEGVYFWG